MQTNKRRTGIFPFFQSPGAAIQTKSGQAVDQPLLPETFASREHRTPAVITARGKRYAIHQIGSMFGSD